jgi:oligopeptidase A
VFSFFGILLRLSRNFRVLCVRKFGIKPLNYSKISSIYKAMTNPLLVFTDLPQFAAITPEHVAPAVEALLKDANVALEKVTAADFPADWKAMSAALDVPNEKLGRAWGAVNHLNSVVDTPELRAAYNEALPKVVEFSTRAGSDEP